VVGGGVRKADDTMMKKRRANFNPDFKLESAQLVLDQDYTMSDAVEAMGVAKSTAMG